MGWKAELPWEPSVILSPAFGRVGVRSPAARPALLPSADCPASTSTANRRGKRGGVKTLPLRFAGRGAAASTLVCAGHVCVVGSGVSGTLGGVGDGAGLSLRQLGGRCQRNVVVQQRVPVKLYVHHLGGRRLGVTERPQKTLISEDLTPTVSAPSVCSPVYVLSSCGTRTKKEMLCCSVAV